MKRFAAITVFLLISAAASAQWINGLTIQPANPTSNDTIRIYAAVSFPSGGCDYKTQFHSVIGSQIQASALHCLGMAAFICSTTDTFVIDPLPAGTYTFIMQLDAGAGPGPCTPGFVPGPNDSLVFSVSQASSLPEIPEDAMFSIYPVPAIHEIHVITRDFPSEGTRFEIIDASGKLALSVPLTSASSVISLAHIAKGNYIARVISPEKRYGEQKFTVIREY